MSCASGEEPKQDSKQEPTAKLQGSWRLVAAERFEKDSAVSTLVPGTEMIKILNGSHFAFLNHSTGVKDTAAARNRSFSAGGGTYTLDGQKYTEHLTYCSYFPYEGKDFHFTLEFRGDTLIQSGEEPLKDLGIGPENIRLREVYVRVK
jgi:hypothetical protein